MYDYGTFSFESKTQVLERAKAFWNPDKTQFWTDSGIDLVIDRREGYFLWDMGGRRLIDMRTAAVPTGGAVLDRGSHD